MVAAVFHEVNAVSSTNAIDSGADRALKQGATALKYTRKTENTEPVIVFKPPRDFSFLWLGIMPPVLGFGMLVLLWMAISITSKGSIPSPGATFVQAVTIFSDPFYSKGPNDQGIGWNILSSLQRVALGFGLAAIVGIPVGFLI